MFIGGGTSFDRTFITFFWGDHGGLNKNVEVYENPGRFMGQQPCSQTVSLELINGLSGQCNGQNARSILDQHRLGNENMHF